MALLNVPATKSALLALRQQLVFAEEGYSLLDRKRELLLLELGSLSGRAARARSAALEVLGRAFAALREAELDAGSAALDRAALGVSAARGVGIRERRFMGVKLPEASVLIEAPGARFGPGGTPAGADAAMADFTEALEGLGKLAGLETSAARLARELKKTQRRCNALSKKVIPDCRETIAFLGGSLEERERESFVILKMIRNRLRVKTEVG
jgi:V/A-type H+-transporting ATPase subunit D